MNPRKEMFEAKQRYADKTAADNREIAIANGMTEGQCDALDRLCKARHEMHCNIEKIFAANDGYLQLRELQYANIELLEEGLPAVPGLPTCKEDYIDIDLLNELVEMGEAPDSSSEEYTEWYNEECQSCIRQLGAINDKVETYLLDIDTKFGTHYAPSGFARLK